MYIYTYSLSLSLSHTHTHSHTNTHTHTQYILYISGVGSGLMSAATSFRSACTCLASIGVDREHRVFR